MATSREKKNYSYWKRNALISLGQSWLQIAEIPGASERRLRFCLAFGRHHRSCDRLMASLWIIGTRQHLNSNLKNSTMSFVSWLTMEWNLGILSFCPRSESLTPLRTSSGA